MNAPRPEGEKPSRRGIPAMLPRYLVQAGFLTFYLLLARDFLHWVGALSEGRMPGVNRPVAIDGFLPISGLMGLRHWAETGMLHPVHPAAALILLGALLTALLLKRGFCSWVCPVFPISEGLWRLGRRLFGRNFAPPFWLDLPLRGLKYLLLGFFAWQILLMMPLPALKAFLSSPYHKIADVRLLQFFQHPSATVLAVVGVLALLCLFVQMAWCRYICPYGALLGLVSLFSLSKIRRDDRLCIRCGLCSSRCPAWLPVMHRKTVRSCECYGCYRCVHGCPAPGAVTMKIAGRVLLPSAVFGALLLGIFLAIDFYGRSSGHWYGDVSNVEIARILRSR